MDDSASILVTGASRGLGRALVERYCSLGWYVLGLVRNEESAERLEQEMDGRCTGIIGDVTLESVRAVITTALRDIGHLDVLINNAGVPGSGARIESVRSAEVEALFQTHCLGAFRCTQAALPFMHTGKKIILNVTSRFGSITRAASGKYTDRSISYSYRIAKASQNMFTIALAQELADDGYVVCGLHPGQLKTRSGASDADTHPYDAAKRISAWIDDIEPDMNGKCFNIDDSTILEW